MGSGYFYLEFLATLVLELRSQGFHNPALLALVSIHLGCPVILLVVDVQDHFQSRTF